MSIAGAMSFLVGALIGALLTAFFQYSLSKLDDAHADLTRRIERICDLINLLADLGCEYWCDGQPGAHISAKIRGLDHYIGLEIAALNADFQGFEFSAERLQNRLSDAVTGGQFEVQNRASEPMRCNLIFGAATEMKSALRRSFVSASRSFWSLKLQHKQ